MDAKDVARRLGNMVYRRAFPIYQPLYSAFKAYVDRAERQLIVSQIGSGSVVVDAGANIGVYSRFLSRCVGSSGVVHSFEPAPENYERLRAAVARLANVRVNQLAVGDITGDQVLYVSTTLNVDHRSYPSPEGSRQRVHVGSTRLDDYFKPAQRVDLLKLDIQGYELHALQGAERVLDDNPGIKLLIEFWPYGLRAAGASAEQLVDFLRARRFRLFTVHNGGKEFSQPQHHDESAGNYFNLFARRDE